MIFVITRNKVTDSEAYKALAIPFAEETRNEKGCVSMTLVTPTEGENEFVFVSRWESMEDWQASVGGPAFNKYIPSMAPYYVSGKDEFFEILL